MFPKINQYSLLPNLRTEQVAVTLGDVDINPSVEGTNTPLGYPYANVDGLTVFETEPVKSNIDIFWETSTGGLLHDLNEMIANASGGPEDVAIDATTWVENEASGTKIGVLTATATSGSISSFELLNAVDGNGNPYTSSFAIVLNSSDWEVRTDALFAHTSLSGKDTFTLTIKASQDGDTATTTADFDVSVTNFSPAVNSGSGNIPTGSSSGVVVGSVQAFNGSANTLLRQKYLTPTSYLSYPSTGGAVTGLTVDQPSQGTMRVTTNIDYAANESTIFPGVATTAALCEWEIFRITLTFLSYIFKISLYMDHF